MSLSPEQWLLGGAAAILVGFSKTGVPGAGILVVPLLAAAFGGRPSVGTMLPMLIFADCFAVAWYRRHTRWDRLGALLPSVLAGMVGGAALLWILGERHGAKDGMNLIIGVLVLTMLGLHLARQRLGDRLTPHSRAGVLSTGAAAGFTTTASNAAGPIMSIYLTGLGMPKEQFMGTTALFFFIVNVTKLPIFAALSVLNPQKPIITAASLRFDLMICPLILVGVFAGKWLLHRIPQGLFNTLVLGLAAAAAVWLIVGT